VEFLSDAHAIASLIINRSVDVAPYALLGYVALWIYSWS
jgi:hypothetical protein